MFHFVQEPSIKNWFDVVNSVNDDDLPRVASSVVQLQPSEVKTVKSHSGLEYSRLAGEVRKQTFTRPEPFGSVPFCSGDCARCSTGEAGRDCLT